IGGLNVVTKNYKWFRGIYNISAPDTFSLSTTELTLNITKEDTFISDINVTVKYNGTAQSLSLFDYGGYIFYNTTVTAPLIVLDSEIPFSWNVTVLQSNGSLYNFTIDSTNRVLNWELDNCTNATIPTLNISFKNISTNDYVNVNLDYVFEYWAHSQPLIIRNFSGVFSII
ncbi:unnamed protein product, partial [marine sediment metagenome]